MSKKTKTLEPPNKKLLLILIPAVILLVLALLGSNRKIYRSLFGGMDRQRAEKELKAIESTIGDEGFVGMVSRNSGTQYVTRHIFEESLEDREAIAANFYSRPTMTADQYLGLYHILHGALTIRSNGRIVDKSNHVVPNIRKEWNIKGFGDYDQNDCLHYVGPDDRGYQVCMTHYPVPLTRMILQWAGFQSAFADLSKPFNFRVSVETTSGENYRIRQLKK